MAELEYEVMFRCQRGLFHRHPILEKILVAKKYCIKVKKKIFEKEKRDRERAQVHIVEPNILIDVSLNVQADGLSWMSL